jgi:hypothetical protein
MIHLLSRLRIADEPDATIADLQARAESISRQLGGWIESIKDSGFQGTRTQNSKTRQAAQTVRRRDEFLARLRTIQDESRETNNPAGEQGGKTE